MRTDVAVIDLFCGVGGLSYGLKTAGLNVIAGIDIDSSCKYAYESNCKARFIESDVSTLDAREIGRLISSFEIKVIVGCAPCQPFSNYTQSHDKTKDQRWKLLYKYLEIIRINLPDIVSMENVPQLIKFRNPDIFDNFTKVLKDIGYHLSYSVVNAADYGVPQKRQRLILLASRLGPVAIPKPTHSEGNYKTVRQAIGNMPKLEHGQCSKEDYIHRATRLNDVNYNRILNSKPGGSWVKDWPDELVLECHKPERRHSYSSMYGRMRWDEPSPTMTTHCNGFGNGRFGHPEQNRAISFREAAMLQSFPEDYEFFPEKGSFNGRNLARHIGNAVPPGLGYAIGNEILNHINTFKNEKEA